ncbi:MAG: response regulator [Gemmatimonadetes bacterium]|nr:response regulator [Gemmatimonadota bacterium]
MSSVLDLGSAPRPLPHSRDLLAHVVAALSRESSLEALYSHAMDALVAALQVERASMLLFDHHDVCRFVAWRGVSQHYRTAVDGHSPWTPRDLDATPIQAPDVELDASLAEYIEAIRTEGIRALLFLPLVGRERVWGKFMIYHDTPREFSPEEVDVAQLIVREIATALDWREHDRELQEERQLFAAGPSVVFKRRCSDGWPVEYVSSNVAAVFGYAPADLLTGNVPYVSLMAPDQAPRITAEVHAHVERGATWFEQEYVLRHADGRPRTVTDFTKVVRNDEGVATHLLGYLVDVTERRAAEAQHARVAEQVRHTQKLESLGVLAGGIAHDFNNLLVGVLGNASLALEDLPATSPAVPLLQDLQLAARRAAELTRQLLAYSGKGKFVIEPIDLSALVCEMGRLLTAVVSKKAQVITELRDDLPAVRADATQIRQVVMNLITNASDALGDAPGTITIRTRPMVATRGWLAGAQVGSEVPEGDYLVLEVSDTGTGMPPSALTRLFDPFFTTKGAGRGLGLAAVLGIVRGHRGAVRVTSQPGAGTSVTVLLPADAGSASTAPTRSTTAPATILVVDDDQVALSVADRILSRDGFNVLTATNGRAALEVYAERGPEIELVLLDLTMPELSGWETFRELLALDPRATVILMSGYSQESDEARPEGAAGFLAKPYSAQELREMVARVRSHTPA